MHSIPVALTWEFAKSRWWLFLLTLLGVSAVPALTLWALRAQGGLEPDEPATLMLHFVLLSCQVFAFPAIMLVAPGRPSSRYALPVSNWMFTVSRLVPGMGFAAAMFVVSAAAINALFGLDWPILGPTLYVAAATACVQAGLLLAGPAVAAQLVSLTSISIIAVIWLKSRYGQSLDMPEHFWAEVTAAELATMLAVTALAFVGTYVAIGWERCGEALRWPRISRWFTRLIESLSSDRLPPIGTRQQALFWNEWQQKGMILPAGAAMILLAILAAWAWNSFDRLGLLGGLFAMGVALPLVGGFIGGILFGIVNVPRERMGSFVATRPATNRELANAVLKTMGRSVFLAWALWTACLLLTVGILHWTAGTNWRLRVEFPGEFLNPGGMTLWIGSILLSLWVVCGLCASALLAGRPELVVSALCGLFGLSIGCTLFANLVLSPDQAARFLELTVYGITALCLIGTAGAFIRARRLQWIGAATPWIALWGWALLVATILPAWNAIAQPHGTMIVLTGGLLSLVVAPYALAPLAIGWNRHR